MEVKEGYKMSEIGLIPEDWELVNFKDFSYMKGRIGWQGLKETEFTNNHDEPFLITGMNFKDGNIRWEEVYHVSFERYNLAKDIQLRIGDVLMTKDGTIGKILFVENIPFPNKATLNSHLLLFRPLKESYHPKYLYYNLLAPFFKKHIELNKSGTTFFGISQESVGKYQLVLPPLPEQQAIAEVLTDTDNLIQALEKQIAKKKLIKQGVMQELLTPKEGWVKKKIGDLCDVRDGTHDSPHYFDNGVVFITSKNIINGQIDFSDISFISKEDAFQINQRSKVDKGDILMSMIGTIGNAVLIDFEPDFCIKNVALLKPKKINPVFLVQLINSPTFQNLLESKLDGGIQKFISLGVLRNLEIKLPPIETQTRISDILLDTDAEITALEQKLSKYKLLKQGLMQQLLTGKIRLIES